MRKRLLATFALSIAMLSEREAAAEDKGYAGQVIAMDAGMLLGGALTQEPGLAIAGFALGSPILHFAHRRPLEGFMSLALRIVAPVVLGFATRAADGHGDDDAAAVGVVCGALIATTLDAAILARAPQPSITVIGGRF
jgi:hypothetical protein